jgi:hypothetical protein
MIYVMIPIEAWAWPILAEVANVRTAHHKTSGEDRGTIE